MDTRKAVTIVTHVRPDVDALVGVWILCRFGSFSKVQLAFVPVGRCITDPGAIHVDTGFSEFDHHQSDEHTCAAQLVYKKLFHDRADPALERLVGHTLKADWYELREDDHSSFSLISIISGLNHLHPSEPEVVAQKTFSVLDALYANLRIEMLAEREYERGRTFESVFGTAFAIESGLPGVRDLAHRRGAEVVVFVDPERGFRGYKACSQRNVDFTPLYEHIRTIEPDADWFLHSSRELLLCGSPKAPDRRLSSLPLERLVELILPAARHPMGLHSAAVTRETPSALTPP